MVLITCPECSREVSDRATSCPQCGCPITSSSDFNASGTALTTIQETSKRLKIHMIFSSIILFIGMTWVVLGIVVSPNSEPSRVSSLVAFAGLIWYLVTRFRIWWHHK